MNMFIMVDDHVDFEKPSIVRETVDAMVDALHNPHKPRPEGEISLPKALQESVTYPSYLHNVLAHFLSSTVFGFAL